TLSVALFVPNDLYNMQTINEFQRTLGPFFYLVWFLTSLGFLAGALGASVANEQQIRAMTYSYRQRARYEEAKEWEASNYYSSESQQKDNDDNDRNNKRKEDVNLWNNLS
ncbi:5,10-methylene-tetrahydrofolate dehydrogenase, partial [Staphylococcus warneri]